MIRCKRCNLPETFETIEFGPDGVCVMCRNHERRLAEDWTPKRKELGEIIDRYRGRHPYDMIIPFSGGKDSTYALWYLMTEFKVKPLVVQYNHGFMRPGILKNNERTLKKLGCDFLSFTANWKIVKKTMLEALIRKTDFCWSCHTSIFAYPMQVAIKEQVPLVMWGEPSSMYTNYYDPGEVEEVDENRFDRFVNLGITADDMSGMVKKDADFDFRDLNPFRYPKRADLAKLGVRSLCLGSYIKWDPTAQSEIIARELGWEGDEVEGMPKNKWTYEKPECWMQGVRDYLKFLKRGYSRISQMCALDIRNGRMTTEEAKKLIAREGMKPRSLEIFLAYIGISEEEFNEYVRATVVPPHVPDFHRMKGDAPHDFKDWYREPCSQKG